MYLNQAFLRPTYVILADILDLLAPCRRRYFDDSSPRGLERYQALGPCGWFLVPLVMCQVNFQEEGMCSDSDSLEVVQTQEQDEFLTVMLISILFCHGTFLSTCGEAIQLYIRALSEQMQSLSMRNHWQSGASIVSLKEGLSMCNAFPFQTNVSILSWPDQNLLACCIHSVT